MTRKYTFSGISGTEAIEKLMSRPPSRGFVKYIAGDSYRMGNAKVFLVYTGIFDPLKPRNPSGLEIKGRRLEVEKTIKYLSGIGINLTRVR